MLAQNLQPQLSTKKELDLFKESLYTLKREIYTASESIDQYISNIFKDDQKSVIKSLISDNKIDSTDELSVERVIDELLSYLNDIKVISLRLAVIPSKKLIEEMIVEVGKQLGRPVVFDVIIEERIIGGAIFELDGIEFRDTLEDKLNEGRLY